MVVGTSLTVAVCEVNPKMSLWLTHKFNFLSIQALNDQTNQINEKNHINTTKLSSLVNVPTAGADLT